MDLLSLRNQIDKIDEKILLLLNERSSYAKKIGNIKSKNNSKFFIPEREISLLKKLTKKNKEIKSKLSDESIKAIFREIISASIALESKLKIAFLGPKGTWTHQAAIKQFGKSVTYNSCKNISDIFDQVDSNKADYGVVPIENSTEGVVNYTLDKFLDSNLSIIAQVLIFIEHSFIINKNNTEKNDFDYSKIKKIYSHPQVFGQCRNWILSNAPQAELIETSSTSEAASIISNINKEQKNNLTHGFIGAKLLAEIHDMTIIDEKIQDSKSNTTRFYIINKEKISLDDKNTPQPNNDVTYKTTIMLTLANKTGALFNFLKPFEKNKINLTKIESRPSKKKDWEYSFFIDIEGHYQTNPLNKVLNDLQESSYFIKILGSYPIR